MTYRLIFLLMCIYCYNSNAQFDPIFEYHGIDSLNSNVELPRSIFPSDLDGDGDIDFLVAAWDGERISWYENTDGQGTFVLQANLDTNSEGANSVSSADIDGDGDLDALSTSHGDDKLAWYENTDGQGTLGDAIFLTSFETRPSVVFANDLDGDGDIDILASSNFLDKVYWLENLSQSVSTQSLFNIEFSISPNPTKDLLSIQSEADISRIEIYNNLGQLVLATDSAHSINVSSLNSGIYLCKVFSEEGSNGIRKIIKE